jgi:glycogen debranching enzyme
MIVWSYRRPENAIADLRTLLQFQQPDGFIPEITFWRQNRFLRKLFGFIAVYSHAEYTDLTQMPVLAYSVRAIWQATRDKNLLQEFVPKIVKFLEWWQSRDHDNDGLVSIIHPWESGIDASPIYDPVFHLKNARPWNMYFHFWKLLYKYRMARWNQPKILRKEWFNFEDVGLCSVYADGWGVLASLAGEFDRELAAHCRARHRRYQEAVIRKCWDEPRGQFVSYFHQDGVELVSRAETIQTLLPLLLDDLPAPVQQKLVLKIKDPAKFWLPYPVPTVARTESAFNPGASGLLWRGPMWPSTTWLVMEGLLKHGFKAEAAAILDRWSELYLQSGIWEYYNPLTGKGLGQKGLGMSTIIVDMLERFGRVKPADTGKAASPPGRM